MNARFQTPGFRSVVAPIVLALCIPVSIFATRTEPLYRLADELSEPQLWVGNDLMVLGRVRARSASCSRDADGRLEVEFLLECDARMAETSHRFCDPNARPLRVRHAGPIPEPFEEGKQAGVRGAVRPEAGGYVFFARELMASSGSRYRAEGEPLRVRPRRCWE